MAPGIRWENSMIIFHRVHLITFRLVRLLWSIIAYGYTYLCVPAHICKWYMHTYTQYSWMLKSQICVPLLSRFCFILLFLSLSLCLVCKFHGNYVKEYTLISERNRVCSCSINGDSFPVQSYNRTWYFGVRAYFLFSFFFWLIWSYFFVDWFFISSSILTQNYEKRILY